jgi:hypothetical protein
MNEFRDLKSYIENYSDEVYWVWVEKNQLKIFMEGFKVG